MFIIQLFRLFVKYAFNPPLLKPKKATTKKLQKVDI